MRHAQCSSESSRRPAATCTDSLSSLRLQLLIGSVKNQLIECCDVTEFDLALSILLMWPENKLERSFAISGLSHCD